jgi:hypothetical protein
LPHPLASSSSLLRMSFIYPSGCTDSVNILTISIIAKYHCSSCQTRQTGSLSNKAIFLSLFVSFPVKLNF